MMRLALAPDQEGYSVDWGETAVASKLEGGLSRLRRDYTGKPAKVHLQWTCTPQEAEYMQTFYRIVMEGTEPFEMDLLISAPTLTRHVCRFIPGTFKIAGVKGADIFRIQAQVEASQLVYDEAFDEGLVTTFEGFGVEGSSAYSLLATIVNVNMPANLK